MTNRLWPADAVTGSPSYSGRAMRQALMAPLLAGATAARPLGAISGVRPGTPDTTVSVAALVWTIKPHAGVLDLEAALAAGPYGYAIDADVTGAVTAANATYARKDGLYVTLSDPAEGDGTATPGVAITYLAGTPAAAPVMPATPARSMLLARLDVPKSGSGSPTATWLAPVLAMAGGVRHYNSVGELPAGLPASESGIVAVIGTGADYAEYRWDGAGWVRSTVGVWRAFVPPWTGLTLGNGASSGRWCRVGNTVLANLSLAIGSTTVFTGNPYPQITAPLPAPQFIAAGAGVAYDQSASDFRPLTWLANDWVVAPTGRISSAIPWAWAAGDYIQLSIAYEAA